MSKKPRVPARPRNVLLSCALSVVLVRAALAGHYPQLAFRYKVGDPVATNPVSNREGPKALTSADLNGDGLPDVITANLDGSVSVLLAREERGLSEQLLCPAQGLLEETSHRAVATADFDGDGHTDVAVAAITGRVVVLRGGGDGTLTPVTSIDVPRARELAVGDLTGDGLPDLLVGTDPRDWKGCDEDDGHHGPPGWQHPSRLCVILGRGAMSFTGAAYLPFTMEGYLHDLQLADLDGNGILDAIALEYLPACDPTLRYRGHLMVLSGAGDGSFQLETELWTNQQGPRAFCLAHVDELLVGGEPQPDATLDIVVANRDGGTLDVFPGLGGFDFDAPVAVPSGHHPRTVAAGDLNGDGFVELVVTNRYSDSISVLRGLGDTRFGTPLEIPAGTSPREICVVDFNGDGDLDAAVTNRISGDVSVFYGKTGVAAFLIPDQFYPAGISPVDVVSDDFNGDGAPDVATACLRSHDVRVRFGNGDGTLSEEMVYAVNHQPTCLAGADLNGDGQTDLLVACGGMQATTSTDREGGPPPSSSVERGSLVALLGQPDGTFSDPWTTVMEQEGLRPHWLRLGDLSGDDIPDVALGGRDGEVVILRGQGSGLFNSPVMLPAGGGSRPITLTVADFTSDGLDDIATSRGDIIVNNGSLFDEGKDPTRISYGAHLPEVVAQSWVIESTDLDQDGNRDILLTVTFVRPDPIAILYGKGDGTFHEALIYGGPDQGVVDLAAADVDGDGILDVVIGNRCGAEVIILRGVGDRTFEPLETVPACRVEGIAITDLNSDGKPDIIGAGLVLWVLVNGGSHGLVEPSEGDPLGIAAEEGLYINEIMAWNQGYVRNELGKTPDWVELYNHSGSPRSLNGWRLRQYNRDGDSKEWALPGGVSLPPLGHAVVWFDRPEAGDVVLVGGVVHFHCGAFDLSRDGETVCLVQPSGEEGDTVSFPRMPANVSYARSSDGARYMAYNPVSTPGGANVLPGNLDPTVEPEIPALVETGTALALTARVFDDIGVAYASVSVLPAGERELTELILRDDGTQGDGVAGDGLFGAVLPDYPAGLLLRYSLRVVDLEGQVASDPDDPTIVEDLMTVRVPRADQPLRITEVLSDNESGLQDERGAREDWAEITNCSGDTVSLGGLLLSQSYTNLSAAFSFPAGTDLEPGESLIVFCDDEPAQGPFHADFRLNREGDRLLLLRPGFPPEILDAFVFPALSPDTSYGVTECGGERAILATPTPGQPNSGHSTPFLRAEANGDGVVDLSDPVFTLNYLFLGGPDPGCDDAADSNDDGDVNITDPVYTLNYLFLSGLAPGEPFPECGPDGTVDLLVCEDYVPCE